MEEYRIVLGIEIGENILRAAEIEHREDAFFLSRIAEQHLASLEVDELAQKLSFLINEEGILSRTVSVAVDTTFAQRDTIEVDSDLGNAEIIDFLKAEIEFHNDFDGEQYVPAYEILSTSSEEHREVLYAALRNGLLSSLKDSCARCGLELQFIDLDHSCSELLINKLQPTSNNHILVTVKTHQIEGTFTKSGHKLAYKYLPYSKEPFYPVTKVAQALESISKEYIGKIYVTGETADTVLIDMLRKNVDERYELLNPTRNLMLSPLASKNHKLEEAPHNFSAVIGAALK
jgi:Tfp pilus assembly PilM family ATPase